MQLRLVSGRVYLKDWRRDFKEGSLSLLGVLACGSLTALVTKQGLEAHMCLTPPTRGVIQVKG